MILDAFTVLLSFSTFKKFLDEMEKCLTVIRTNAMFSCKIPTRNRCDFAALFTSNLVKLSICELRKIATWQCKYCTETINLNDKQNVFFHKIFSFQNYI